MGKGGGIESSSDAALLTRIRARDRQAFEVFYRSYHPRLWRFLAKLLRHPPLIEEVINDTMMVVWEKSDGFAGRSTLATWVFGIAYRQALGGLRRHDEPVEQQEQITDQEEHGPEQVAGRERTRLALAAALDRLSPAHRAVVTLTYQQEFGYREIAEILECPIDTVKTRMFHARRQLRQALPGELADWL